MLSFIVGAFATYYMSLVLTDQDGPFGVFWKIRQKTKLLDCFICISFWVGICIALALNFSVISIFNGIAYAGAATIIWMLIDE